MRKFLRIAGKIAALVLVVALAVALWKREEITRLMAVNSLFTEEKITRNFSHMDDLFLTRPLPRGDHPVSPLPEGPAMELPQRTAQWIENRAVTAFLVLKGGRIVHESYYRGTEAGDLRISWSMAKSFLSILFGTVLEEGAIASLDDPVLRYVPTLKGTAYDGTTVRQVLNMTTGVKFDEDYLDFHSDINRMGRVLALGGSMDEFAASLREREAEPGTRWKYVSIDTHVLGMIIAGATGRDPADLMVERVIQPMGFEAEPYFLTDGEGTAFVLGGLNMSARDYARFGQMVLQGGEWQGRRIVSGDWIAASIRPSAPDGALYGYQWWIPEDAGGDVMARGIYGQYIYISPRHDTVIVVNAADRRFREDGVEAENEAMFKAIAASR